MNSPYIGEFQILDEDTDSTIFDKKGNSFLAFRKVSWFGKEAKLELRKWQITKDGDEKPLKGFTFLTDKGINNLVNMLIAMGYGDINGILDKALELNTELPEAIEYYSKDDDEENYNRDQFLEELFK